MKESTKPFHEALQQIMEERDVSQRELSRRTQDAGWGTISTIHHLFTGELKPTFEAMEKVAAALRLDPMFFSEYRLAKARRQLDEQIVGLRKALKNLDT